MTRRPLAAFGIALLTACAAFMACHETAIAPTPPKAGAVGGGNAVMNLAQMTFIGRMNGDAAIPQSLLSGPDGGPAVCVATVTNFASYPNPYSAPLTINYSMVGGGGGGAAGTEGWLNGGGGGSSGLVVNGQIVAFASGGNGGNGSAAGPGTVGSAGSAATGSFVLPIGSIVTAIVGGGGGGGGLNAGGGGGAGLFGGGGGSSAAYASPGGGGSSVGGTAGTSAVAGSAFSGGASGGSHPGAGGASLIGGLGAVSGFGGPGGGGYGGGGGVGSQPNAFAGNGGSNGGNGGGAGATQVDGGVSSAGLGANSWAFNSTLPAAAGAGGGLGSAGALGPSAGGNAGLVILSYVPPTGVCALQDAPPGYVVSATTGGDAATVNLLQGIPPIPDASLLSAQTVEYEQYILLAQRDGGPAGGSAEYRGTIRDKRGACAAIVAPTAVQTFASSDAGPDAAYVTPAVSVTSQCSDSGPCNCILSTPCGMGKGRYLDCTATTVLHVAQ